MISQQITRRAFLAGVPLVFGITMVLAALDDGNHVLSLSDIFRTAPGLDALAAASHFPNATAIGLGFAGLLSLLVTGLSLVTAHDRSSIVSLADKLSRSQKVLYGACAVLIAVLPWISRSVGGPHQFSYGFFQLIATHPMALGIFASGVYAYSAAVLIFVRCLFLRDVKNV